MLRNFKKLITSDPQLVEVQQNVYETVTDLQATRFVEEYEFEDRDGIANNTEVALGLIQLPEGEYILQVQANVNVVVSSPTFVSCYLSLNNVTENVLIGSRHQIGVGRVGTNDYQSVYAKMEAVVSKPTNVQVLGLINVSGGTVTSRNIRDVRLRAFRRTF